MTFAFHDPCKKMKVVIMVSRFGHCWNDLLYRWRIGALPIDIVAVISNHLEYQKVVVNHDILYINITKTNKAEAEQMRIVRERGPELIVLARYMQILSDEMCPVMSGGVKLIGVRVWPRLLFTQRVFMSQEGTTCWGWMPTGMVSMTW